MCLFPDWLTGQTVWLARLICLIFYYGSCIIIIISIIIISIIVIMIKIIIITITIVHILILDIIISITITIIIIIITVLAEPSVREAELASSCVRIPGKAWINKCYVFKGLVHMITMLAPIVLIDPQRAKTIRLLNFFVRGHGEDDSKCWPATVVRIEGVIPSGLGSRCAAVPPKRGGHKREAVLHHGERRRPDVLHPSHQGLDYRHLRMSMNNKQTASWYINLINLAV